MLTPISAIIAALILFALTIFQITLIMGKPLGEYAWGGYHKILPTKLKIASISSIFIYLIFILIFLVNGEVLNLSSLNFLKGNIIWVLVVYFFLGVFINGISQSKKEKTLMVPIAAVLFFCSLVIAL